MWHYIVVKNNTMKRILTATLMMATIMAGCANHKQEYKAADGSACAVLDERSGKWTITGADGREVVTDYDSMRVTEVGEDGHPMTIVYYKANRETLIQYYSSMTMRARGDLADGKRDGLWQFFFEDGSLQAEASYVDGREDGPYRVLRENGVPYYIGQYSAGARTGTWEIYDPEGNLSQKIEY